MKLLIVDDQPGVTEGLCHGVNWAQLGFSQVQAVNSVREARAAMLNTVPDVMLCDIEMPEETGLELFKWVKKQGFATRCIFLTAHAKFSYAQEAMHLGAFDYIIQPAPYSEISLVTARAVKDVQASRDQKELTQMGRAFNEQAQAIAEQMGFDANTLLELGREADYAAFSGGDVTQEHAERYWHDIAEERKFMLGSLPTFRRWRAKLSLADVFHFRKIRLRKIGVKGRDS